MEENFVKFEHYRFFISLSMERVCKVKYFEFLFVKCDALRIKSSKENSSMHHVFQPKKTMQRVPRRGSTWNFKLSIFKLIFPEGACLAKVHKCNFVEVSAQYSMNISELWTIILKQLQAPKAELEEPNGWMHRIVTRGKQLAHSAEQIVQKFL